MQPDISVITTRTYTPQTLIHRHPFTQIVLPDRGRLDLVIAGRRGAVAGGQYAVVTPETEHSCWAGTGVELARCLVVDLPTSLLDAVPQPPEPAPFKALDARSSALVHLLRVESASGGLADRLVADTLGRYAVRAFTADPPPPASRAAMSPGSRLLARGVREYLDAHCHGDLTLGTVAQCVGASVAHIQRGFRAEYGMSVVAYVHARRLTAAADLLSVTDLTVSEIAIRTGFGSPSYLARLFSRHYGASPSRYRSTNRSRSDADPSAS